jgi:hypothetical protein
MFKVQNPGWFNALLRLLDIAAAAPRRGSAE